MNKPTVNKSYAWLVIGAGPAGIAAVGQLLDHGIEGNDIAWVDPQFKVGDFQRYWRHVESNTPVEAFRYYYEYCNAFNYDAKALRYFIDQMDDDKHCPLLVAAQPLHDFTQHLRQQVCSYVGMIQFLHYCDNRWQANFEQLALHSKNVILAIGSVAKTLSFDNIKPIPLSVALNKDQLSETIKPGEVIALFGAAQSAASALHVLKDFPDNPVFHFYRRYESFDYYLGHIKIDHVQSMVMTANNLLQYMPAVDKVISAIGFERRQLPIRGLPLDYSYDQDSSIIAPGLFGIGIAFPELLNYRHCQPQYPNIALPAFMERLECLLPMWLQSNKQHILTTRKPNSCDYSKQLV